MEGGPQGALYRFQVEAPGLPAFGENSAQQRGYLARGLRLDRVDRFFSSSVSVSSTPQRTNLFADFDDLATEILKTVKRLHLLLRLAQGHGRIKRSGNGLLPKLSHEPEMRTVAAVATPGTVTSGFTALAGRGGNGAPAKIADAGQPTNLAYTYAKKCATKKAGQFLHFHVAHPEDLAIAAALARVSG
ncbi:MAG: hypothetical protein ABI165_02010 [Bryobacteraceae bacterium]